MTIFFLTAGGSLAFYAFTTYMQKFLTNTAHFSKDQATEISAASLVVFLLAQPAFSNQAFSHTVKRLCYLPQLVLALCRQAHTQVPC